MRRLNILRSTSDLIFMRDYFEKYSIIATRDKEVLNDLIEILGTYDIKVEGRLGRWCEVDLCNLLSMYLLSN